MNTLKQVSLIGLCVASTVYTSALMWVLAAHALDAQRSLPAVLQSLFAWV